MQNFKKGDIVQNKSSKQLMLVKLTKVSKEKFNKAVLDYLFSDDYSDDTKNAFSIICEWEENGVIKSGEFEQEELELM